MTLLDNVRAVLNSAPTPLNRNEIFAQCEFAENVDQISRALHTLLNNGEVEKLNPLRPGASARWQSIGHVSAPKPTPAPTTLPAADAIDIALLQTQIRHLQKDLAEQQSIKEDLQLTILQQEEKITALETAIKRHETGYIAPKQDQIESAAHTLTKLATIANEQEGQHQIAQATALFNTITGRDLRPSEGWLFTAAAALSNTTRMAA